MYSHTHLITEPSSGDLVLASTTLQKSLALLFDVGVDLSTAVAARLLEASWFTTLVVIQSREELSLSGAAEAIVDQGHHRVLVALNFGHEVAKVFDVGFLDSGSVFHHDSGKDDLEVLAIAVEVTNGVPLGSAVFLKQLVSQSRIKLVQDESVLLQDCQSSSQFEGREMRVSAMLTVDSLSPWSLSRRLYSSA